VVSVHPYPWAHPGGAPTPYAKIVPSTANGLRESAGCARVLKRNLRAIRRRSRRKVARRANRGIQPPQVGRARL